MQGMLGKKIGMTRVFDDQGRQIPVTAIACGPCVVLQKKTKENDGYEAVQLAFGDTKESRLSQPDVGRFKKLNLTPKRHRAEFSVAAGEALKDGDELTVALFEGVSYVDIEGVSKGKGFQGVMRRHHMAGGTMTHGGHSKRRIGSIGCRELPGNIHKGKRMPGHMGHTHVTQQNLQVIQVRKEDNVLLVRGSIPGPAGAVVMIKKSLKKGQGQ